MPFTDQLLSIAPTVGAIAATIAVLAIARRVLERGAGPLSATAARTHVILFVLSAVGLFVVILVLPINDAMRGQILSFLGILLSAAIALSATTFLGNTMAGVMLRAVRHFHIGDFLRCGEHFGRVTERGIFHVEIQTEDRDLTTLPNLYLVTNPVTTVRSSGTIVSATVSLGYGVPHDRIEACLLEAARAVDLGDPFVQVLELDDFSVRYRVAGMLDDVKQLLTTRSRLRVAMLDALHGAGIEIVSPTFMNTRALAAHEAVVARAAPGAATGLEGPAPEELIFDKAERAESLEVLAGRHAELVKRIAELRARAAKVTEGPERGAVQHEVEVLDQRRLRLDAVVAQRKANIDE